MQALAARRAARHHRPDARHPLAADPLRHRACCRASGCSDALRAAEATLPRHRRHARCPPASCTCRCPGTTRRRWLAIEKYMRVGARRRALVPEQHRVHPPHQRPRQRRRRAAHRLRRQLPGARPRRRLPRRAGRDAGRSAPPPGHDQVQPGAHLDAGERRRHRRRLPVHLRHGGPGRLPVRRPHRADVEHATARPPPFRDGKPWLLRFFDQIRFYPVEADELLRMRAGFLHGRVPLRIEEGTFGFARLPAPPARQRRRHRRRSRRQQQAAFEAERERWAAAGQDLVAASPRPTPDEPPPAAATLPPGCVAVTQPGGRQPVARPARPRRPGRARATRWPSSRR